MIWDRNFYPEMLRTDLISMGDTGTFELPASGGFVFAQ